MRQSNFNTMLIIVVVIVVVILLFMLTFSLSRGQFVGGRKQKGGEIKEQQMEYLSYEQRQLVPLFGLCNKQEVKDKTNPKPIIYQEAPTTQTTVKPPPRQPKPQPTPPVQPEQTTETTPTIQFNINTSEPTQPIVQQEEPVYTAPATNPYDEDRKLPPPIQQEQTTSQPQEKPQIQFNINTNTDTPTPRPMFGKPKTETMKPNPGFKKQTPTKPYNKPKQLGQIKTNKNKPTTTTFGQPTTTTFGQPTTTRRQKRINIGNY